MAVLEGIELGIQDAYGILYGGRALFVLQLYQEAFPQVTGTNSGRLKLLDNFEHILHLLGRCLLACAESEVIHQGFDVPAEVAVIVKGADDEGGDGSLVIREIAVSQLLLKALGEALLNGEGVVLGALVLAPVVYVEVVGGNVIVLGTVILFQGAAALLSLLYLRDGDVAGFLVTLSALLSGSGAEKASAEASVPIPV